MAVETTVISIAAMERLKMSDATVSGRLVFIAAQACLSPAAEASATVCYHRARHGERGSQGAFRREVAFPGPFRRAPARLRAGGNPRHRRHPGGGEPRHSAERHAGALVGLALSHSLAR